MPVSTQFASKLKSYVEETREFLGNKEDREVVSERKTIAVAYESHVSQLM